MSDEATANIDPFAPRKPVPTNTSDPRLADLCFDLGVTRAAYYAASKAYNDANLAFTNFIEDVTAHQIDRTSKS